MGLAECRFLIPFSEDAKVGNGRLHPMTRWEQFHEELTTRFPDGWSFIEHAAQKGPWRDPEVGDVVWDESRIYVIAIEDEAVQGLKDYLAESCRLFRQRCIYFSCRGDVEFIRAQGGKP